MTQTRAELTAARRWVVKIGSSLLTDGGQAMAHAAVAGWAQQIAALRERGIEVVVVSSGAVAAGMLRLGLPGRPAGLAQLQAAAAIGQLDVASMWDRALQQHGLGSAQVLLTHEDAADRRRFLNARNTLRALLDWGVVPVVNENDTVANDEIRFGDNDTLGAVTVELCSAGLLVILTDQQGIYSADPRQDSSAQLLSEIQAEAGLLDEVAGGSGGALGRGGMQTKVLAARMAARSGVHTVIAGGGQSDVLLKIAAGETVGSWLRARPESRLPARKRWIAAQRRVAGKVWLDEGACRALRAGGRSLLPVGVLRAAGNFWRGDLIACLDEQDREVARGLSNYDMDEARRLCGVSSVRINEVLGRPGETELIHRDNLILADIQI